MDKRSMTYESLVFDKIKAGKKRKIFEDTQIFQGEENLLPSMVKSQSPTCKQNLYDRQGRRKMYL